MEKEDKAEDGFCGEIGSNLNYSKEEKEEDILEVLYQWWKDGQPLTIPQICLHFDMTKREISCFIRRMVKHGYLKPPEKSNHLELTPFGKSEGAECLMRHQYLTQFLQMVCGLNEERAEENACRMEHVVSGEVLHGICDFIKYGDTYDRVIRNSNLRMFYDVGSYEFFMGIYCMEKRYPRVLAEEDTAFSHQVLLQIRNDRSYFYLRKENEEWSGDVWYKADTKWERALETEDGFRIPTEVFSFTFGPRLLITEGYGVAAFCPEGAERPAEEYCRELNVHLW